MNLPRKGVTIQNIFLWNERMYTKQTVISNASGLHARPASDFIAAANTFTSDITIRRVQGEDTGEANAKSIVHLLTLGLSRGENVEISAKGDDEQLAVDSLIALIDSKFGEEDNDAHELEKSHC